jgi:hypothetical protein
MTPPKVHNCSITKSKDTDMVEMLDKEFKKLILKMMNDHKEDSNKQMNEIKKSLQDLDEKVSNMDEKFSNETEIL